MLCHTVPTLLALAASAAGSLVSTGATLVLDDINFFIPPFSVAKINLGSINFADRKNGYDFVPVSVLFEDDENLGALSQLFTKWATADDVWQPAFGGTVLTPKPKASYSRRKSLSGNATMEVYPIDEISSIPAGPYFLHRYSGQLYQAFRLYEDISGSFTQSLLQGPDGDFRTLSAQIPAAASLTMGVPSRLYFRRTKEQPLAGVRVGVKDIYALKGAKNSCGNRAWYGLYPAANITALPIQNLIDAGAVIVGLQKLSQFANGETPTADWVDYHAPFNPRGDGYQDTASSSSGAGASIASYQWLDLAVGSDTGGSVRGPANNQGVFGNRPSHGLVSLDNVMPLSPALDTPGLLARDPAIWDAAMAAMYRDNYTSFDDSSTNYPKKIYVLDFPSDNTTEGAMLSQFVTDLSAFLNASTTTLDLNYEWESSGPEPVRGQSLSQLLNLTYTALITMDQIQLLRDPFYADYAVVHDGRLPFVDPVPLTRWDWGEKQPQSVREDAVRNKTLFMDWFNKEILPSDPDTLTCTSGILLHTDSTGYFSNRNRYLEPPKLPFGFSNGEISVFTEAPDSVFPLGEIPIVSSITNHTEYLPVSVDVMVAKGCDGIIGRLAKDLVAAGIISVPKAGSTMKGGEIHLRST